MNYKELKKELNTLDDETRNCLILELMLDEKIDYISISNMYVALLEKRKKLNEKRGSLFSNCLGWSISGVDKKRKAFFESQACGRIQREPQPEIVKWSCCGEEMCEE